MQKLEVSHAPHLENKINELIDEIHDLQDIVVQQNTMIAKQLDIIRGHKAKEEEIIRDHNIRLQRQKDYIEEMKANFQTLKSELKAELPEVLRQAVKEQDIDVFQNWLKKEE